MKIRTTYGDANWVGRTVTRLREERQMKQKELLAQLQTRGVKIGESGLSQLEGQFRTATDKELLALSDIFGVPIEELYNACRRRRPL